MPKKKPQQADDPYVYVNRYMTEADMRRTELGMYGEAAFGPRWQTPMADAISKHIGRKISVAQVNHWVKEVRPVPRDIYESLHTLLPVIVADLRRHADEVEEIFQRRVKDLAEDAAIDAAEAAQKVGD